MTRLKSVSTEFEPPYLCSVDYLVDRMLNEAQELGLSRQEANVRFSVQESYGNQEVWLEVSGRRPYTDAERVQEASDRAAAAYVPPDEVKEGDRALFNRLKAEHPDWLES